MTGTDPKSVLVLAGGLSHERDVSLRSGRRVAEALRGTGLEVVERDVDAKLLDTLRRDRPACVVPMLHGETGEDGAIREILELLSIPYVGATPAACRAAFDKPVAKMVVTRAGLRTPGVGVPAARDLPRARRRRRDGRAGRAARAAADGQARTQRLGPRLLGRRHRARSCPSAMVNAFAYGSVALLERFVTGTEVAVPVVDDGTGPRALPAVGIRPDGGVYDYTARYTAGATEFEVPAPLSAALSAECARVAVAAHEALGLRDLSRSDLIVSDDGTVWFLEVNVAPGFTETSTVPLSIAAAGLELGDVAASLVRAAVARDEVPEEAARA